MSFWEYANPVKFMALSGRVLPFATVLAISCLLTGLVWGFFFTADDFKQGSTVKIIFLHVPAALMAINIWLMMLVASLIWLVRRHHVSALAARAAAPIGITMTLIALFTGAIWGKPMWGTYWAWDPRLTSFMILFVFYLGYAALWQAVEDDDTAADLTSILCMVGSVFALLSRYAVNLWNQGLHQAATLTATKQSPIDASYYYPLLVCIVGFITLFITLVLLRTRMHIRLRRTRALLAREAAQ
ncbi:heme ABC transporter permease [Roseobacter sp. N2S]|uniref:heme ABC transporter permease n=1 Tax=Roseobacter sp. N2S TaxID=2663844 RepID=UPI00286B2EF1|nr:heme ABC transporter permease [Roseobacter sp. N2S]